MLRIVAVRHCKSKSHQPHESRKLGNSGRKLTPLGQGSGSILLKIVVAVEMAFKVEVVMDRGVSGGEFLQGLYVPEFCHSLFRSSKRLV